MAIEGRLQRLGSWLGFGSRDVDGGPHYRDEARRALDSLEYELQQLRRDLAGLGSAAKAHETPGSPAGFGSKLLNPEYRKQPEWWAVLGLNQ